MTARVHAARGGHVHAEWETQPLLRSTRPRRRVPLATLFTIFAAGLLLGAVLF
ncbi:hypothetical protein [Sphingobium cloacae]|uniref:hypothetical protein n=1 Tax=Sphingobium cloacae TaxID=120107 RepID=UPI000B211A08|nr:hypothetical protein [Sphingobium cloacae]